MQDVIHIQEGLKRHAGSGEPFELYVPELRVLPGEVCLVAGSSGCGKTTLLDALGCASRFTRCQQFSLAGTNVLKSGAGRLSALRRQSIGYVLQQGGLIPFLTARENILLPAELGHMPQEEARERLEELAQRLGISHQLSKRPHALSIGQRQRVSIARALLHRPPLLLADEPTGALDPASAQDVRSLLIAAAREQGCGVVLVSHDVDLFTPVADTLMKFRIERGAAGVRSTLYRSLMSRKEVTAC